MLHHASRPSFRAVDGIAPALRGGAMSMLAVLIACGANLAPVLEVQNAPVIPPRGVTPTTAMVRDAIVRALASRNWQIAREHDSAIEASVSAGGHSAAVLVQYDDRYYSITRVSSTPGLKYDGTRIHRRYNHWIDRLRASINQEIGRATEAPAPVVAPARVPAPSEDLPPEPPPPAPAPAATTAG